MMNIIIIISMGLISAILIFMLKFSTTENSRMIIIGIVVLRLFVNVIIRLFIFPEGNLYSYDEQITIRNLFTFKAGLENSIIHFHDDSDGYLTAIFVGAFYYFFQGLIDLPIIILIWLEFVTLFLAFAAYKLLKQMNYDNNEIPLPIILLLFFDWIIFPTTNFRSEAIAIPILVILLYLNVQNKDKETTDKRLILFELLLLISHFLTFFFYSIFIVFYINKDTRKWKRFQNRRRTMFFAIHLIVPFIYSTIFRHRSFEILRRLNILTTTETVLQVAIYLKFIYVLIWMLGILTPLIGYIHLILVRTKDLIHNQLKSHSHYHQIKNILLIFTIVILLIIVYLVVQQYTLDFRDKGWLVYLLNSWKILGFLYLTYGTLSQYDMLKTIDDEFTRKTIQSLLIASIYLLIVMTPVIFVIYNVHLRLIPTIIIPFLLYFEPSLRKFRDSYNTIFLVGLFLILWLNIFNGSAIILTLINS